MIVADIKEGFAELPGQIAVLIYTQGCSLHCEGCFNYEIWEKDSPTALHFTSPQRMLEIIKERVPLELIGKNPWIVWLGGDPLEQTDLADYLTYFHEQGYNNCVYTGREFTDVPFTIKSNTQILKTGPWKGKTVQDPETNQQFRALIFDPEATRLSIREFKWPELQTILNKFQTIKQQPSLSSSEIAEYLLN